MKPLLAAVGGAAEALHNMQGGQLPHRLRIQKWQNVEALRIFMDEKGRKNCRPIVGSRCNKQPINAVRAHRIRQWRIRRLSSKLSFCLPAGPIR